MHNAFVAEWIRWQFRADKYHAPDEAVLLKPDMVSHLIRLQVRHPCPAAAHSAIKDDLLDRMNDNLQTEGRKWVNRQRGGYSIDQLLKLVNFGYANIFSCTAMIHFYHIKR